MHDVCSTVQALGVASPAFAELDLEAHGVEWVHPPIPLAHPLDGGRAATLHRDVDETAAALGVDAAHYRRLFDPLVAHAPGLVATFLAPLGRPAAPVSRRALRAARDPQRPGLSRAAGSTTDEARALLVGAAAHAIQPLTAPATAGYGLFLLLLAHAYGWPVARGGSQSVADALGRVLRAHGGEIVTGHEVTDLAELPHAPITMLDVTPRQLLRIGGRRGAGRVRAPAADASATGRASARSTGRCPSRSRGRTPRRGPRAPCTSAAPRRRSPRPRPRSTPAGIPTGRTSSSCNRP